MVILIYLILTMVGLGLAGFAFARSDRRADMVVLFLLAVALVMVADWVAFGWFGLYKYHPHLLADEIADSALGELLADILFVPALTVALEWFLPGLPGVLAATAVVTLFEALFFYWGLFSHHGWKLWFTAAGFPVYFATLDLFWHDLLHNVLPPARRRMILRVCLTFNAIALLTLFLRAGRLVVTNLTILPTYLGNQSLGRFFWYVVVVVPPGVWVLGAQGARRWVRLGWLTVGISLMNVALTALDIQYFIPPWSGTLDALAQGVCIGVAGLTEDRIVAAARWQGLRDGTS